MVITIRLLEAPSYGSNNAIEWSLGAQSSNPAFDSN